MRGLMKAGAFLLGTAVVLTAIPYDAPRAQDVGHAREPDSDAMATETRPVDANVNVIKLSGPIDLKLKQGATPSMNVHAEQRLLSKIVTAQNGNTLQIGIEGVIINRHHPMVVELTLPALQELRVFGSGEAMVTGFAGANLQLSVAGSGDVNFDGQYRRIMADLSGSGTLVVNGGNSDDVEFFLHGSGDVTARGTTKSLVARLSGSGVVQASDLHADNVNLSLMGAGYARVFAKTSASVAIRGSGDVAIAGNPAQRSVSKAGSGNVRWE